MMLRLSAVLSAAFLFLAGTVYAQEPFPSRPVRIIIPYPPGTLSDILPRFIGQRLSKEWGQPIVIDNKPGANGIIGTSEGAKAQPNGYTWMVGAHATMASNPHVYRKLTYSPLKDFDAVESMTVSTMLLVVHPSSPMNTLADLVEAAKRKPDALDYATYGVGSASHLTGAMLNTAAGIKLNAVHYKAIPITDVVSGQIPISIEPAGVAGSFVKSGRVKVLAQTSLKRHPAYPNLPTVAETFAGFDSSPWVGFFVPKGTPKAIIDKISRDVSVIVRSEEMAKTQGELGAIPMALGPEKFDQLVRNDHEAARKLVEAHKMYAE